VETRVTPLGTSAAVPTRDRHLSSVALERKGRVLLFDCGEGTQFRLMHAGLNRARVDAVFVTHLHGDHFYGLPGLAATIGQLQRTDPVTVVGPSGLQRFLTAAAGIPGNEIPYSLRIVELPPDTEHAVVYETDEYTVEARPIDHRIPCFGYRFRETPRPGRFHPDAAREKGVTDPRDFGRLQDGETVETPNGPVTPGDVVGPEREGISVAYLTDTRPCDGGRQLANGVDLVYHDATFTSDLAERADETGHSTARQAASVAHDAEAKHLLLGHVSARYEDASALVAEARTVFPNTDAADELTTYVLDPREKWDDA